jgi:broad specificity phosphatase PhoE
MPATIYVARHGETDYNRKRIVQGRGVNSQLNPTGRAQAERLGARLAPVSFDALYSSPLTRARQTANAVLDHQPDPKPPVRLLPGLEEIAWGDLEGVPASPATRDAFDRLHAQWSTGDFETPVPGGESIVDVQTRVLDAWQTILDEQLQTGGTALVVAHGRLMRVLLASILPGYGLERMQDVRHANTGLNILTVEDDGSIAADLLNCTRHWQPRSTTLQ